MVLAAYTARLCKFNGFNANGLFGRDKGQDTSRCAHVGHHPHLTTLRLDGLRMTLTSDRWFETQLIQ